VDPHVLHSDHAPTPFTAAEIRRGCPAGRCMRLRVAADGAEPYERTIRFTEADEDGAVQEFQRRTADDAPDGEAVVHRSTWLELQEHASFPAELATIEPAELVLPFGRFDCQLYTVRTDVGLDRFWFARDLPGMPARYESLRDDRVVASTVMIVNEMGAP
jgi:hypothetical protein